MNNWMMFFGGICSLLNGILLFVLSRIIDYEDSVIIKLSPYFFLTVGILAIGYYLFTIKADYGMGRKMKARGVFGTRQVRKKDELLPRSIGSAPKLSIGTTVSKRKK